MTLTDALKNPSHTILDVRTENEFDLDGRIESSINIPLHEIPKRLDEIETLSKPLVLCCQSGARSQQALEYLKGYDLEEMVNGMGWTNVLAAKEKLNK